MGESTLKALIEAEDWEPYEEALVDAVNSGPEGERILLHLLNSEDVADWKLPGVIGAIGECDGDNGIAALHELAENDSYDSDYRYPAIVGLTQRIGADATDVLARCIQDDDRLIRNIAARAMAYAGDGSQWDAMWTRLNQLLTEPAPLNPDSRIQLPGQAPKLITIVYLARYSSTEGRRHQLVRLIRSSWDRFHTQEQQWLLFALPATDPGQDGFSWTEPNLQDMVDWVKHPVFDTKRRR